MSLHPGRSYLESLAPWKGDGEFSLKPIKSVLAVFGNPQDAVKSIHIGGTNGKGSVSAMLAAILRQEGYRVGLSISPHLEKINERIVYDDRPISDSELFNAATELKDAASAAEVTLTYHEALTAISFLVFARNKLDWIVIEVGLGGRLDASNVLERAELVAITSIGRDHEAILGSELTSIASEKAAIIKPGNKLVLGEMPPYIAELIEKKSRGRLFGRDFTADWRGADKIVFRSEFNHDELVIDGLALAGEFQLSNTAVAIEAARYLGVSDRNIAAGIQQVAWPGRLETLEYNGNQVVVDGAHNIDAIAALVTGYKYNNINKLSIIFGVLGTKRWQQMLEQLIPFVSDWHLVQPNSEMAIGSELLARHLSCFEIRSKCFGTDLRAALDCATANGQSVLVCGSLYLVGAVRAIIAADDGNKHPVSADVTA